MKRDKFLQRMKKYKHSDKIERKIPFKKDIYQEAMLYCIDNKISIVDYLDKILRKEILKEKFYDKFPKTKKNNNLTQSLLITQEK